MTADAGVSVGVIPDAPTSQFVRRRGPRTRFWRRAWALPVSIVLHGGAISVLALLSQSPPPPPYTTLPRIELLAPMPQPSQTVEAMPSPAEAPVKSRAAAPTAVAQQQPMETLTPLRSANERAESMAAKSIRKKSPPKDRAPAPTPTEMSPPLQQQASEEAALPVSENGTEQHPVPGDPSSASRPAGPPPDYVGLISGLLEKAKRYPTEARAAGHEGIVRLRFTLDASGRLLNWQIQGSSGFPELDEEAGHMVQRAAPFPAFPATLNRQRMALVVPIEFSLKRP